MGKKRLGWVGLGVVGLGAILLGLGVLGTGCTIVSSDEPLDGGFYDGNVEAAVPTTACNECLFQQCSGAWAVCQNQSECLLIYACATKQGCDQSCINACFCAHPTGQNSYVALAACDSYYSCGGCNAQCKPAAAACTAPGVIARDLCGAPPPVDAGASDAGAGDASTPPPVDAALPPTDAAAVQDCAQCTSLSCKDQKDACATGSECDAYAQCLAVCQDAPCFDACAQAHATGKTASQALENCTLTNCKSQCGL
jgi:hypothetical protein